MKTLCDFLRRHALLLLAALVVLSVPAGVALGKYVKNVEVTKTLNLNVSMVTVEPVTLLVGPQFKNVVNKYAPTYIEFCKSAPTNATSTGVDLGTEQGRIKLFQDNNDNSRLYVVSVSGAKIMANSYCANMFQSMIYLEEIRFDNFDTSTVTTMKSMFSECAKISSLDLSHFNTENVEAMSAMFDGCTSLSSINLSSFNTAKVDRMRMMFRNCSSMTSLDLSSFNTGNVTDMDEMFSGDSKLVTIYATNNFSVASVTAPSNAMFSNCTSLVGGEGTNFYSINNGKDYAHIDGGTANPGYFTAAPGTQSLTNSVNVNVASAYGFDVDHAA